jgi:NAD+ diphosphatase
VRRGALRTLLRFLSWTPISVGVSFTPGVAAPSPLSSRVRFFVVHTKGLVLREVDGVADFPSESDLTTLGLDLASAHYVGRHDDVDCFALPLDAEPAPPFVTLGLRGLFGRFDEATFAVAGRALQIAGWAETHRFCGRCATPTERDPKERCLRCPRCALAMYPRVSPAIIVLVRRGDEALLARSSRFPVPFFSTLAGFVEAGESLEETLHREVREEVGIEVDRLRYFGSQPWPFPHSLMVGFTAQYVSGELRPDPTEIAEAQWFLPSALPTVPPRLSIARALIDAWCAEVAGVSAGA